MLPDGWRQIFAFECSFIRRSPLRRFNDAPADQPARQRCARRDSFRPPVRQQAARRRHSSASPLGHSDVRSASVPANFLVRQTKKAGAWPASPDCSSAVSRLKLIRRVVLRFEAHCAFDIYVRRRHFELRLACACCAQVAVRTADSLLGLAAVVLALLLRRYELRCTAKATRSTRN